MGLVKRLSKKTRPLTGILKLQVIIDADNLCVQDSKCPLAGLVGETQPSVYIEENDAVQVFASLLTSEKTENIEVKSMAAEPPASVSQSTLEPAEGTDRQTGATPEEVEQMLVRCLGHRLTGKPTAKLSNEILRNLQGAPLQDLAHRINDRLRKITSYGMVANLATDCAFSFHQVEQERAAREQPRSIALGLVDAETRLRLATEYEAYRDREIQSRIVSMGEAYGALVARVTREVKMKFPLLTSAQMRENVDVVVKHEIADELNLLSLDDYSREHTGG
jgi:hypothetical protein